jgi:hypothetical protein
MSIPGKSALAPETDSNRAWEIMEDWYKRVRINIDTHNYAERLYDRWNTILAVANICSIVTVAVLASSVSISSAGMKVLVLALGLTSAVASCLQLQLSYGEKAAANRLAARQYGALRRAIEVASGLTVLSHERAWQIREIQRQWDFAASSAPNVPERIRMLAKKQSRGRGSISRPHIPSGDLPLQVGLAPVQPIQE